MDYNDNKLTRNFQENINIQKLDEEARPLSAMNFKTFFYDRHANKLIFILPKLIADKGRAFSLAFFFSLQASDCG